MATVFKTGERILVIHLLNGSQSDSSCGGEKKNRIDHFESRIVDFPSVDPSPY